MDRDEGTHYLSHVYDPLLTETAPSTGSSSEQKRSFWGSVSTMTLETVKFVSNFLVLFNEILLNYALQTWWIYSKTSWQLTWASMRITVLRFRQWFVGRAIFTSIHRHILGPDTWRLSYTTRDRTVCPIRPFVEGTVDGCCDERMGNMESTKLIKYSIGLLCGQTSKKFFFNYSQFLSNL